jgi:hypothetical protein
MCGGFLNSGYFNKCRLTFLLALINHNMLDAQVNLVPNPGFETFTTCPVGFSSFNGYVSNWNNPSGASPDYMNSCANPFPAGAPANGTGYQVPHTGNGYAGAYLTGGGYREFIQIQLSSPMVAGQLYDFKMYVVLHNKSKIASDDIGACFSVRPPTSAGTGILTGSPVAQVNNPSGNVITDSLNWTMISGPYLASGGEQYVTLGHFKSDAATTFLTVEYGGQGTYYYFDDVSVISAGSLPVELLSFDAHCGEHTNMAVLQWETASEKNVSDFEIEKSLDGKLFYAVADISASGNSETNKKYEWTDRVSSNETVYYRLKENDRNGATQYFKTISFTNSTCNEKGITPFAYFSNNRLVIFSGDHSSGSCQVEMYDAAGRIIFSSYSSFDILESGLETGRLAKGIYSIAILGPGDKSPVFVKAARL